jgi:predicted ribonuclease toxin of YeeF-YezG toxin-antitoxin module
MTKHLDVAQCLKIIEGTNAALQSYMDHFDFMEAAISRVLELEGSLKGKGGEALLRNYQELQLPAIRAARAFISSMMDKGEKLRSLILSFEPSENGMVSEDFYRNQVTRGYDRFEQFMEQNKAEVDAIAASVSHIIDLGKLDIRHVQDRVDDARKHAKDVVEGLYELDHEGMRLMRELQREMVELKAILKQVTEWTISGGALLNGVDLNEVRSHFADKTLHTKAPEVSVKLATPNPLIQYANDFPLRFKYDTMHSIMKVFDLSHYQKWFSSMIRSLPLTSFFNVARASTAKTSNTISSAPYHTIPQREPSVWAYANAHYSGDKETVERAAEAIRELQQREKENQEPYNPMRTVSAVLDFLPFVGNAKAGQEAASGVNMITEEELDEWDRGIAVASIFLGGIGRIGGRTLKNIIKGSDDIPDALRIGDSQATGGTINNLNKGTGKEYKNYNAVEYTGNTKINGEVRDISRRVYQRIDIDYYRVDPKTGKTNYELMKSGRPPIWEDGTKIELHHLIQREPGSMVEIPSSMHKEYDRILHGLVENGGSFRNDPVLKKQYENFRSKYWRWRANQIDKGE